MHISVRVSLRANLVCYVWPCFAYVTVHFPHDSDVLVAVKQRKLFIPSVARSASVRSSEGLKTCIRKNDYQSLCIFVCWGYWHMLLRNELW